ncbi:DUF6382 domain-containing protein [Alkaliphilus crotonatoxidans]
MKETTIFGSEISYENDMNGSYLVLRPQEQIIYLHQIAMLMNSSIPATLPFNHRERDGLHFLYYEITSRQPLKMILNRRKLKQQELLNILLEILQTLLNSSAYLLNYHNYLLDESYIYLTPSLELSMVYLPYEREESNTITDLKALVNRLILALDPNETVKDSMLHKILMAINEDQLTIRDFHRLLMKLKLDIDKNLSTRSVKIQEEFMEISASKEILKEDIPKASKNKINRGQELQGKTQGKTQEEKLPDDQVTSRLKLIFFLIQVIILVITILMITETALFRRETGAFDSTALLGWGILILVLDIYLFKKLQLKKVLKKPKDKKNKELLKTIKMNKKEIVSQNKGKGPLKEEHRQKPVNDNMPVMPQESYVTELVEIGGQDYPQLMGVQDGLVQWVEINKPSFIIGKLREQVDLQITDKAISRIHAEILCLEEGCWLRDLNSKNGTYLNGNRINSNVNYPIKDGDHIKFANREFTFIMKE